MHLRALDLRCAMYSAIHRCTLAYDVCACLIVLTLKYEHAKEMHEALIWAVTGTH